MKGRREVKSERTVLAETRAHLEEQKVRKVEEVKQEAEERQHHHR